MARIMNTVGDSVEMTTASAEGCYIDQGGVPRHVAEGDPIPPGWMEDAGQDTTEGKKRRGPAANKAKKAPAEEK